MDRKYHTEPLDEIVTAAFGFRQFCDVAKQVLLGDMRQQLRDDVQQGRMSPAARELFENIVQSPKPEP